LLDDERQISELLSLERRQHWGGRSSIDHPVGASYHDDAINATAGAAVMASLGHGGGIIRVSPRAMAWASISDRGRYWEG